MTKISCIRYIRLGVLQPKLINGQSFLSSCLYSLYSLELEYNNNSVNHTEFKVHVDTANHFALTLAVLSIVKQNGIFVRSKHFWAIEFFQDNTAFWAITETSYCTALHYTTTLLCLGAELTLLVHFQGNPRHAFLVRDWAEF